MTIMLKTGVALVACNNAHGSCRLFCEDLCHYKQGHFQFVAPLSQLPCSNSLCKHLIRYEAGQPSVWQICIFNYVTPSRLPEEGVSVKSLQGTMLCWLLQQSSAISDRIEQRHGTFEQAKCMQDRCVMCRECIPSTRGSLTPVCWAQWSATSSRSWTSHGSSSAFRPSYSLEPSPPPSPGYTPPAQMI